MAVSTADQTSSSDAEILFTSIFGASAVLLAGELLFRILIAGAASTLGGAVLARTAPLTSVRPMYAFFVLLPVGLALLAIGVPFLLRTLQAALRGRLQTHARWALVAVGACVLAGLVELRAGGSGSLSVLVAAAVGAWQGNATLARLGDKRGFTALAAAGLTLAGLARYEGSLLAGDAPSVAIAPTLLVATVFFVLVGLASASAAALRPRRTGRRIAVALCWLAVIAWLASGLLRARLADAPAQADWIELASTIGAATVLFVTGFVGRLRA